MEDLEQLTQAIHKLTEEISEIRSSISNHFNPEYYPNVANELKQLNELIPGLIEALKKP